MKTQTHVILKKIAIGLTIVLAITAGLSAPFSAKADMEPDNRKTVRVAFYEDGEFQTGAEEGAVKSGYAYEYYRKLASLTGWKYEYVYGDWESSYNALITGDVDILAGISYSEDRLELMNFPDLPMGYEKFIIYKRTGDKSITLDKNTLNGKKIGTISGFMENELRTWIEGNNIKATVVVYGDLAKRDEALASGEVQVIFGESTCVLDYCEAVYTLKEVGSYIVTAKDRLDLLSELNIAQNLLYEDNPTYQDYLHNKYFKQTSYARALKEEEKEWLSQHDSLNIGYILNFMPYSGLDENGKVTGIVKDVFPEMFGTVGLADEITFNYVGFQNYEEMIEGLHKGEIDVLFPIDTDINLGEKYGIYQTASIFEGSANLVYTGNYSHVDVDSLAIERRKLVLENYARKNFNNAQIVYFDTQEECLQAVLNGFCDGMLVPGLSTSNFLSKHNNSDIHYVRCRQVLDVAFAVTESNVTLLKLLDHCVSNLDDSVFLDFSYQYTEHFSDKTLLDFAKNHMGLVMFIFLVIIVALTLAFAMYTRANKKEKEAAKQRQRQLSIVNSLSKDYQNVFHINTSTRMARIIKLDGYITKGMKEADINGFEYMPMCERYIEERVFSEDRAMMTEVMKLDNICQHLKNSDEYAGTYRVNSNGDVCYYRYKYLLTDETHIIAGFQNVDTLIRASEKQKEELQTALAAADDANRAKTSFLFNMSHDIRTPMNAIIGFADLAKKHKDNPEKQADCLDKIISSGDVLLSILNNVLEMARIEKGTVVVENQAADMEVFADSINALFEEQIKNKNISFESKINVKNRYIYADIVKIREIFINIVSNAIKYTNPGGKITVTIEETECPGENMTAVRTSVSDTGIGMSEEFIAHIFEEFVREHNSEKNVIEGTGLGMAITKRLVDILGGTIEVKSKLGKGSTFTVVLPHSIARKEDVHEAKDVVASYKDMKGKRILMAEDNDLNAEIAIEILTDSGFEVERAEDGKACVRMIEEKPAHYYDFILMDVQMPNMNGYEATRKIRDMEDKSKADIPIIAVTANAFEEDKRNAIEAGMNGHLAKPIDVSKFTALISEIIEND